MAQDLPQADLALGLPAEILAVEETEAGCKTRIICNEVKEDHLIPFFCLDYQINKGSDIRSCFIAITLGGSGACDLPNVH
jgi:hypothetical protein